MKLWHTKAMSDSKVSIGLLGAGARIRGVVSRLLAADKEGRIQPVAAYDPDPLVDEAIVQRLGVRVPRVESEEALLNDPSIDWIFIGSFNAHHPRHAIAALNAGKNVFCEKPLATTLEDCIAIRDAVQRSGKTFAFGLVLRYSPHYQRIKQIIDSGAIGKIISFEFNETLNFNHGGYIFGNWRRKRANAGTHVLEKCCHDIDLANWIVGSLPVRTASFGGRDFFKPENAHHVDRIGPNSEGKPAYQTWPDPHRVDPFGGDADIFDNQVAILQYANGVRATFHTNCNAAIPERRFYICGTEGTLRADVLTGELEVQRIGWDTERQKENTQVVGSHGGGDEYMAEGLVRTLLKGETPLASVEDGIKSAVAAFGIDEAADTGCVIDYAPLWQKVGIEPR